MSIKYFAYGSNMSPKVMSETCPNHRFICRTRLRDHRLAFSRRSVRWSAGVADVIPAKGATVWGVLYEIEENEIGQLDHKEGYPNAYDRFQVKVDVREGLMEDAFTYAVAKKEESEIPPKPEYVDLLVEGATAHKLPRGYIAFLQSLKEEDAYRNRGDFFVVGTESRVEADGMPLLKITSTPSTLDCRV